MLGSDITEKIKPFLERGLSGEEVTFEYQAGLPDGREADIRTMVLPDLDETNRVRGYYALSLNVSDQKKAETALAQAQKMEAVAELSGGLAHDFNNLLTVVLGNLLPLKDSGRLGSGDMELLNPAIDAARRGASLIKRLLTFSRQEPLEPVSVDVARLVEGVVGLLRSSLPQNVEVASAIEDDEHFSFVDPIGLENALVNLSFNARDAMPEGGRLSIGVQAVPVDEALASELGLSPGDYVRIAVTDTGSGIDPATLERVFEPFFSTKAPGSGTGLGLSMVYGFTKQSAGAAQILSECGKGTEVALYLPRGEAGEDQAGELEERDVELGASKPLVLLVDDDQEVRRVVRRQLTELGHPTIEASDGDSALELLLQVQDIEILLSDVVMPGRLSGFDLAREARAKIPTLTILLMSAFRDPGLDRSGDGPKVTVLSKPFDASELERAIRQEAAAQELTGTGD